MSFAEFSGKNYKEWPVHRVVRMIKPALVIAGALLMILGAAFAQSDTIHLGSKSDSQASLFSYDQKFVESVCIKNYEVGMSASERFVHCERLTSNIYLKSNPDWVDMALGANFTGEARIGYVVLDPDTMDYKDEMALVDNYFVGTFTLEDQLLVIKNRMNETGFFGPCMCGF
jgi:hypothetical protein